MQPTRARAEVLGVEWLFEPFWPGRRLIGALTGDDVRLTDADGRPADGLPELGPLLKSAVRSESAVIDGVWSPQPHPAAAESEDPTSAGPETDRWAFVAVDLLALDGDALLDVPWQERRRLLESVVRESVRVRIGPAVKVPLAGWLGSWREAGFDRYLAKHQNGRYRPGERSPDWLEIPIRSEGPTGIVAALIGRRDRVRRVGDGGRRG